MTGYDIVLTRRVCESVTIPVVSSGGAGNYEHMLEVITEGGASAVAAARVFQFIEQTPLGAKKYLAHNKIPVRI